MSRRYIACRELDGADLFECDGLEILGVVEAPNLYPEATQAAARLGSHVGAMPWDAGTRAQRATAERLAAWAVTSKVTTQQWRSTK